MSTHHHHHHHNHSHQSQLGLEQGIGMNYTDNQLKVLSVDEKRMDMNESGDIVSIKLKEQVAIMKKKQALLLKELEEMDRVNAGETVVLSSKKKESVSKKKEVNEVKGKEQQPLPLNPQPNVKGTKSQSQMMEENFVKKTNEMNIKLFEMQERIRQKEMDKVKKEQEEKLYRYKKEKEVFTRQTDKIKGEIYTKNNKLKEQIERARIAKEAFLAKQQELFQAKEEKESEGRKVETKKMQVNYDIEIAMSDLSKLEGYLSNMKLQVRERENELKTLQENTRVESMNNQKLINELGEAKKDIAKLEFEQSKLRDDRDRLIRDIERKNEVNNKRYTSLFQALIKIEANKSEKAVHISSLNRVLDRLRLQNTELRSNVKVIETKIESREKLERKIKKRDKKIFELEALIETQKKEKRVEIVEKIIEKPIVIDKPVIVEKPVVIREEIRINEPVQLEIVRVKSEMNNLSRANSEMVSEVEYWRKKCLDQEDQQRNREQQYRLNFENERLIISEKINTNDQQIRDIKSRLLALFTEVETLFKTNNTKNLQLQNILSDVYNKNQNIETLLVNTTHIQQPPSSIRSERVGYQLNSSISPPPPPPPHPDRVSYQVNFQNPSPFIPERVASYQANSLSSPPLTFHPDRASYEVINTNQPSYPSERATYQRVLQN